MPIETLDDVIESMADQLHVYGAEKRSAWVSEVKERILKAAEVDCAMAAISERFAPPAQPDPYPFFDGGDRDEEKMCDAE